MAKDWLRYDQIVERQLRGVVRHVLAEVAANGLPATIISTSPSRPDIRRFHVAALSAIPAR